MQAGHGQGRPVGDDLQQDGQAHRRA
jgi:hypothetical protein